LFPDMPLPPEGVANDDYLDMPKGVMGAIDEAIALGIADPDRTALMGDSYGGYSVYSLLTYTRRFKAAIASAGLPDLGAAYGVFPASMRYDGNNARLMGARLHYNEQGQDHMGGPPSANVWRYLTNSPVYHLDRVETPLLMIHGDMDDVPMEGTEEYFTGLYRLGKRAEFVRYWGEGHWLVSPANIRDMWARIFAWLDEFDDVSRDATGNIIFDGDHVRSRNGAPALKPEDFLRFERQTKP
jgi:dipeptidyl aminopeptidase/acylaminoacyl peptidase